MHELLAEVGEVEQHGLAVFVEHLRADRHLQHDVLAVGAMAVLAHAMHALRRLEVLLVAVVDQRVEAVDGFDDHVAALAAIAAARPAEFDEFLAAERDAAVPAVAGTDIDLCLVEEFHGSGLAQGCSGRNRIAGCAGVRLALQLWSRTRFFKPEDRRAQPCRVSTQ